MVKTVVKLSLKSQFSLVLYFLMHLSPSLKAPESEKYQFLRKIVMHTFLLYVHH